MMQGIENFGAHRRRGDRGYSGDLDGHPELRFRRLCQRQDRSLKPVKVDITRVANLQRYLGPLRYDVHGARRQERMANVPDRVRPGLIGKTAEHFVRETKHRRPGVLATGHRRRSGVVGPPGDDDPEVADANNGANQTDGMAALV